MTNECMNGELMRKALALMSDGKVRNNIEIIETTHALQNSMSRICLRALRAGLFEVAYRTRDGMHFRITEAGLIRCADIDRDDVDRSAVATARARVRLPASPRQWFEV